MVCLIFSAAAKAITPLISLSSYFSFALQELNEGEAKPFSLIVLQSQPPRPRYPVPRFRNLLRPLR